MNRGAARTEVFLDDADRLYFLERLSFVCEIAALEVHAYVLMGNHYHLLLRSRQGQLAKGMQRLSSDFTYRFNRRHSSDGALFRGRYHSIEVNDDAQLLQTLRYIHLNPVTAQLAPRAQDWPWSSAAAYEAPERAPPWLRTEELLSMFGENQLRAYRDFMQHGIDDATSKRYAALGWGATGSDPWV